ncbi:MAG: Crp/Fnr family transcriptional regulator [Chromatiales bacterium]|nr:Crp/Fnr family transcriptional regulator [Chromatiales bacterium]
MSTVNETMPVNAASLTGIGLFAGLGGDARTAVARRCQGHRYRAGAQIVAHDSLEKNVYFILGGTVRVTYFSAGGKEISFRDLEAGQMFGEIAAIDDGPRSAYVVAHTDASLACMTQEGFLDLLQSEPPVALAVMRHLTMLVRRLSDRVIEFSTLGVKNRIHAELLRLAEAAPSEGEARRLRPAPKHADIASRVSTHREAVTRELAELARGGVLERREGALMVIDLDRLRRMVVEVQEV